jgi:hypothetical protein
MTTVDAKLPRPGVEVLQVFRTVSPTVITPTLLPCVVGVCKQVLTVLSADSAGNSELNSKALVDLPAFFVAKAASGTIPKYTGLDGHDLVFTVNSGSAVSITFEDSAGTGLRPSSVVTQVNTALTTAGVSSVRAKVVGDAQWMLYTVGTGEFQEIVVLVATDADTLTAFGLGAGKTYTGIGVYNQYETVVPEFLYPDPRGNIAELSIEQDSVRVFLATGDGSSFTEALRTQAFCRNGEVDDAGSTTGDVSVDTWAAGLPAGLNAHTVTMTINGGDTITKTYPTPSGIADLSAFLADLETTFPGVTFSETAGHFLKITNDTPGYEGSLVIPATDAWTDLGIDAGTYLGTSIEAIDDGNGDAVTPILHFTGETFTTSAGVASVVASTVPTTPLDLGSTLVVSDGQQVQTVVFTAAANIGAIVAEVNAVMGAAAGGRLLAASDAGKLKLTHLTSGTDSMIKILGGTALVKLDPGGSPTLVAGTYSGVPSKPEIGDELWIDGEYYAEIVSVGIGAADRLKVNRQVPISSDVGKTFYVVAKNLPSTDATRPAGNLVVGSNGSVTVKQELFRDTAGNPSTSTSSLYLTYRAVRLDVTSRATTPGLLTFDSTTELESNLEPVTVDNPLALGMYFGMLNAPGVQMSGLGVDAISADAPYGTVEAYTRAAEALEAYEVYAIALLTHDETVAQVYNTHVSYMSEAENKGERIVLWNPEQPTRARYNTVTSGTNGNTIGSGGLTFDTGVIGLGALLLAQGVDPTGTIAASEGVYLDIASDSKNYSVASISGSQVTIRITFDTGDNDDEFYSTTDLNESPLPSSLVQETFALRIRGAELVDLEGYPDKTEIAAAYYNLGRGFANRRFWMIVENGVTATLDGLEQLIEGFYLCAAIAGMIGQQPPQQSFTNFPITGFTGVKGTNNYFSTPQLDTMAAGGCYTIVQDAAGVPLTSRMALTTDVTSIETRTDSITKVVDFCSKFIRRSLRNFIGRFNITQGLLDSLGSVLQGVGGFLVENGVLIAYHPNNILQDEDAPDTVLVDSTLEVPYPCNYVRVTLVI